LSQLRRWLGRAGRRSEAAVHDEERDYLRRKEVECLCQIATMLKRAFGANNGLSLSIPNQQGDNFMGAPVTLTVGAGTVQATVQETLNGTPTGTLNGPIAYASDTPAVCTIDPTLGVVTPVAPGTANVSAADAVGNLSDTVVVTVVAAGPTLNNGLILTIPPQAAPAPASTPAAKTGRRNPVTGQVE
jgi:hypothetical protein